MRDEPSSVATVGALMRKTLRLGIVSSATGSLLACGSAPAPEPPSVQPTPAATEACELDARYFPRTSPSASSRLPPVSTLIQRPARDGDAYTVWGASYGLRSPVHRAEVETTIRIVGYITKTNLEDAPRCAVHPAGVADPADCFAPIPTFWIGDAPDAPLDECIEVLGWASGFAQVYEAMRQYDSNSTEPFVDHWWGSPVPNPLPARGARVVIEGDYSSAFRKASSGVVSNSVMGVFTLTSISEIEPAPELATLPGVRRKRR
jgi:hypothetical protein